MVLGLSRNRLSGHIPIELTSLPNLGLLYLHHNELSGEISPEFGRLPDLVDLRVSFNQLTGQIPAQLGDLDGLTFLGLNGNRLSSGAIPPELGSLVRLEILRLEENRLTGPIPPELGRLTDLRWLLLDSNQLSGPIPAELSNLSNLEVLNLSANDLSGEIPTELERLAKLESLRLANRDLEGCIPVRLRSQRRAQRFPGLGLPFCDLLLNGLVVSPGSLNPQFDPYRTDYTAEVSAPIATILATGGRNATLRVLGDRMIMNWKMPTSTCPAFRSAPADAAFTRVGTVKVVAADGGATHKYTIDIRRVLGAPTIAAVEAGGGYLAVSWAAPDEFAEARTASYDLRYIPTTADESVDANWTVVENVSTVLRQRQPAVQHHGADSRHTVRGAGAGGGP